MLADRIGRVLADPARAAGMGQASRMIAEAHSLEHTLAAFEALYRRLLKRPLAAGPALGENPHAPRESRSG